MKRLDIEARIGLQSRQERADVLDRILALERPVVETDEALAVAGRAADVGVEHRHPELVHQIIVAPAEGRPVLALGPAVDPHQQGALAGEFRGVGAVEEARHFLAVEAGHLDQLGLGITVRIEPAGLARRPARDRERSGIDREGIAWNPRRLEVEPKRAPGSELEVASDSIRELLDPPDRPAAHVEEIEPADPGLVAEEGDRAPVVAHRELLDVPVERGAPRREPTGLDVERAEPLEVAALIAQHP